MSKISSLKNNLQKVFFPQGERPFFCSNQSGFTFVELIFSAAVILIVIVGALQLFVYTAALTGAAREQTLVVYEAESTIDDIRNDNFDNTIANYNGTQFALSDVDGVATISAGTFGSSDLLSVTVSTAWTGIDGHASSFTLTTFIAKY